MPFFDADEVANLARGAEDAEQTLDLRGALVDEAREALSRLLETSRFSPPSTVVVLIDPAGPETGETLFLPVGRQLLDARRRQWVTAFSPLANPAGGGFFVALRGRGPEPKREHGS